MNLEWNVWCNDLNTNNIKPFNVFNHCGFNNAVTDIFSKRLYMDEFEEMIDKEAKYYFWYKAEYEVLIGGLFGRKTKIDIYSQLKLNWDKFIDYLWNEYINKVVEYIKED